MVKGETWSQLPDELVQIDDKTGTGKNSKETKDRKLWRNIFPQDLKRNDT